MSRHRRILSEAAKTRALAACAECRAAAIGLCQKAPIGGEVYRAAEAVLAAVDEVAAAITGHPRFLYPEHATAGGRPERSPPTADARFEPPTVAQHDGGA